MRPWFPLFPGSSLSSVSSKEERCSRPSVTVRSSWSTGQAPCESQASQDTVPSSMGPDGLSQPRPAPVARKRTECPGVPSQSVAYSVIFTSALAPLGAKYDVTP